MMHLYLVLKICNFLFQLVLILVVMDDALVHIESRQVYKKFGSVLILVVMDDALVLNIYEYE